MIKLILGLILWWVAHLIKRLAPAIRRDLAKAIGIGPSKGLIAILLIGSTVLLVTGFRSAPFVPLYTPLPGMGHLNNLLMLFALFTFGIGMAGGPLSARVRHPMLLGVVIWAVAHLLVNGDLASVLLFGGLGAWAVLQMRLITHHEGPWERPMPGDSSRDWKLGLTALFMLALIAGIHWLFGHNPFLGTYP